MSPELSDRFPARPARYQTTSVRMAQTTGSSGQLGARTAWKFLAPGLPFVGCTRVYAPSAVARDLVRGRFAFRGAARQPRKVADQTAGAAHDRRFQRLDAIREVQADVTQTGERRPIVAEEKFEAARDGE